ncbi:MAG: phosphoglucosamine mutase [Gammaproteobacteria bacterium]
MLTTKTRQWFGTDGIRGTVGVTPITTDFFTALGYAVGLVLQAQYHEAIHIFIGRDPRESGKTLESHFIKGLFAAGVSTVHNVGIIPTPGIAYLTRKHGYHMGIMISASHNIFSDNGIKFFCNGGLKLPDEWELAIEKQLQQQGNAWHKAASQVTKNAIAFEDGVNDYGRFCVGAVHEPLSLTGLSLIVDCANGAMYHIAPQVLKAMGATVTVLAAEPNGRNINAACGATNMKMVCDAVLKHEAHLGMAFDGDGDRLILVDHTGAVVDGDEILFILLQHYRDKGLWSGGLVGTQMTNLGLERACEALGVPFVRSAVGDRYVLEVLQKKGWHLGGENSGHILCFDKTTTGDGLLTALQVLSALQATGKTLYQLKQGMKKYPQVLVNVPLPEGVDNVLQHSMVQNAKAQGEMELGNKGRILLRLSGTEPLVRVMVEGEEAAVINKVAHTLADTIANVAVLA